MSEPGKVDQAQLMRYIELEKEIQGLERQNPLKEYEVKTKAAEDLEDIIKVEEIKLQELVEKTKKEKIDVDNMLRGSIKEMFQKKDYKKQLSKEQEEYLEAKNAEEVARQKLEDMKKQLEVLKDKAKEYKGPGERLKHLFEERDRLLSDIFGGEYGSEKENYLEAQFDNLIDKKNRVSVALHKWRSGRVLLQHAVNQLGHAVFKWDELGKCSPQEQQKRYTVATVARNNNIAAIQNVRSCQIYLGKEIKFPYLHEEEVSVLERATNNIYIDMQTHDRVCHAGQCYVTTWKRASALLQWFDGVINGTIQKDLDKVSEEARRVEKDLRAERIKLIRDKVAESGGDVKGLNDAGLKGLTDGFSHVDQQKLSDDDLDMKGIGVTRPAPVDDTHVPDAQMQEPMPPAPTPLPLSELAPTPSENDLFGDISELKEQFKKYNEDYMKTQDLNKARMEQGLQAKLAARRHKKM